MYSQKNTQRVWKSIVRKNKNELFYYSGSITHGANALYNAALYVTRQAFIITTKNKTDADSLLFLKQLQAIIEKYNNAHKTKQIVLDKTHPCLSNYFMDLLCIKQKRKV